jgi:hypothetical protein
MTERSRKWPEVRRNDGPRSRSESSHDGGYGGYSGGYGSESRGAGTGTTIVTATTGAEVDPMEACTLEEAAPEAGPRAGGSGRGGRGGRGWRAGKVFNPY